MQIKPVHLSLLRMTSPFITPLFFIAVSIHFAMDEITVAQISGYLLYILDRQLFSCSLLVGLCYSTFLFTML